MFKKFLSGIMAVAVCVVGLSGCGESQTEEVEMPEIVFITSHHDYGENIKGYFITNDGEMKMYDFRNIAPDETYDLLEVMDQLDSALCTEIDRGGIIIKEEDLPQISKEKLLEYYKTLKKINKNSKIVRCESGDTALSGYGHFYGIRYNRKDEQEIITLNGWGMFFENNLDKDAKNLNRLELFPGLL
ncbi:MAG: hypothetical protein IJN43_07180 [Ruminococcus sp.]|nr:hypothetical protein [Ruminococcus sp.]